MTSEATDHGFLLDEEGLHKLPDPDLTIYNTFPDWNALNDNKVIIGTVRPLTDTTGLANQSFILEKGRYTYFAAPAPYIAVEFHGINNWELIVGEVLDVNANEHGLVFYRGKFATFDVPGAIQTVAQGVNNRGDIVGQYFDGTFDRGFLLKGFPEHPSFFTIDGRNTNFPNTVVNAINDDGVVAGKLSNDGPDGTRNQVGFVAEPED